MIHNMKRQILLRALTFGVSASALILTSCNTTESRISKHPEIFQRLSPRDQALVSQGKIREGMTQDAVRGACAHSMDGAGVIDCDQAVQTWIYNDYVYADSPYPYPFGPFGYGGYYGGGVVFHSHYGRRFAIIGDPFYDPFYYSYFPPRVAYPSKTVTFANGRVVSLQILTPPRTY